MTWISFDWEKMLAAFKKKKINSTRNLVNFSNEISCAKNRFFKNI